MRTIAWVEKKPSVPSSLSNLSTLPYSGRCELFLAIIVWKPMGPHKCEFLCLGRLAREEFILFQGRDD